jgi:hypothetical protein
VARLNHHLTEWRHEQIQKSGAADPMELMVREGPFRSMSPEQMIRRLERTGRAHVVEDLKRRLRRLHPGRF